jgi:hypothetical protein
MKALLLRHIAYFPSKLEEGVLNEYTRAIEAQNILVTKVGDGAPIRLAASAERTELLRYGLSQLLHVDVVILIDSTEHDPLRDALLAAARACSMDVIPAAKFHAPKFDCNDN